MQSIVRYSILVIILPVSQSISDAYETENTESDTICILGASKGGRCARILAGMIHKVGSLSSHLNLCILSDVHVKKAGLLLSTVEINAAYYQYVLWDTEKWCLKWVSHLSSEAYHILIKIRSRKVASVVT